MIFLHLVEILVRLTQVHIKREREKRIQLSRNVYTKSKLMNMNVNVNVNVNENENENVTRFDDFHEYVGNLSTNIENK
jgi:hypothetical protein